jgi:hypothetical protein
MQSDNTNDTFFDLNRSISALLSVAKKRWKLLLLFYIFLLAITVIYSLYKRKVYETSFTITNAQILSVESKTIFEGYSEMQKNNQALNSHSDLKLLEVEYLDDSKPEGHTIKIKMSLYDTTSFPAIMKDLMDYANNNYVIKEVNKKTESLLKTKESYVKSLEELTAHKAKIMKENIYTGYDIFKDIAAVQESISKLEYELSQFKGFEVSVLPVSPFKAQGFSLIKSIILAGILGLVFCPFLVFFFDKIAGVSKKE